MKPRKPSVEQDDLLRARLVQMIDMRHELVKLAALIDWEIFEREWAGFFPSHTGRPATSPRLVAGLCYLQHAFALSDEAVLDPGRRRTKTGYLWALARDDRAWGSNDPPGVVYFYAPDRRGENAEKFLTGFNGILQVDGYTGYNRLTKLSRKGGEPITTAYCWAHARRKLKEVFDRDGSEIAAEGLRQIAEIYAVEKDIRGISPGQRLSARQARSVPLVATFGEWLRAQRLRISTKSLLNVTEN